MRNGSNGDLAGRLILVTDPAGNTTTYQNSNAGLTMDTRIRVAFIAEPFKGSERTLLFFKPVKWPYIDSSIFVPLEETFRILARPTTNVIALHQESFIKPLGGVELYARCDSA